MERSDVDGVTVLRLSGSLSSIEMADVERSFREATGRDGAAVVLDLSGVDFVATPAISMFLAAAKTLRESGGRLVATGPQPHIGQVLQRLRLDRLLPVESSVEEGVARLKRG